jgi:hypothetical protein
MLDKEALKTTFNQMHKIWIEPELARRKLANILPDDFKIYRFLIRLPKERPPIVEFNDEIHWLARVKLAPGTNMQPGQDVYVHDIDEIFTVEPPQVEGKRVAFMYFFWTGNGYQLIFDFTPNWPEGVTAKEESDDWQLGEAIAESLQAIVTEKAVHIHDEVQALLRQIGLWAVPTLLPYPLSRIAKLLKEGNVETARATLLQHCTPAYMEALSSKWWSVEQFEQRKTLIQDALHAHKEGKYRLSIPALLPQVEGTVTDWTIARLPETVALPWRQESKTKKFRDLVLDGPPTTFTYKRIVESTIEFILNGPVLETFKQWMDEINSAFPNRHVVEHGKYDERLYTEENSVKLLLLLDTIYHIISAYSGGEIAPA